VTEEQPPNRPRGVPIVIYVMAILGVSVLVCGLYVGGMTYVTVRMTQPAADFTRAFLESLGAEDYATAYEMLSDDFQAQFGGADEFEAQLRARNVTPVEVGTFTSRSVRNSEGRFIGPVTMADGAQQQASVFSRYNQERETWVITGFRFE
jgi:hypothetical protein